MKSEISFDGHLFNSSRSTVLVYPGIKKHQSDTFSKYVLIIFSAKLTYFPLHLFYSSFRCAYIIKHFIKYSHIHCLNAIVRMRTMKINCYFIVLFAFISRLRSMCFCHNQLFCTFSLHFNLSSYCTACSHNRQMFLAHLSWFS